jgi:CubicO group peptidase (beta-lactamase class C family)
MPRTRAVAPAVLLLAALTGCAAAPRATTTPAGAAPAAAAPPARLVPAAPADVGMSAALPRQLDSIVVAAIADRASPGAAIVVGRYGRLVLERGWGRQSWPPDAPPASDSTIYDMASLTKVVATTTAAMLMEEDGRLDIERPVVSYLPEFNDPEKAPITVRMLLLHTSGMKQYQFLYREVKGRAQYLQRINAKPLLHRPGERFDYTDWNMMVLQQVVERVAGKPLDSLLAERVFGPLGMRDTGFNPPASLKPRIAPTEVQAFRGGQVWGVVHDENAWAMGGVSGHAGLFSSARDLAVFTQMLLNGGEYGGVRILRPETVARWTARQRKDAARSLGWEMPSPRSSAGRYFSPRSFGHTGFTGTSIWADPEKQLFVVLLTNRVDPTRDNPRLGPLRRAVADAVQRAVVDAPLRVWEAADSTAR